ncbi:hypothetical protein F7725_016260 [Dissostichus mawsoni]|uniref:Uncharacterized protein n=1 Tax=Dissostichus mawsoni TaxID=36200 RepID=A0A7J5Z422_DISMA|nr:hypothetical protein F7725_016260 [Dissostichus mawsoni]
MAGVSGWFLVCCSPPDSNPGPRCPPVAALSLPFCCSLIGSRNTTCLLLVLTLRPGPSVVVGGVWVRMEDCALPIKASFGVAISKLPLGNILMVPLFPGGATYSCRGETQWKNHRQVGDVLKGQSVQTIRGQIESGQVRLAVQREKRKEEVMLQSSQLIGRQVKMSQSRGVSECPRMYGAHLVPIWKQRHSESGISRASSVLLSDPCFQLHSIQHLLGEDSSSSSPPPPPPLHHSLPPPPPGLCVKESPDT